MKKTYFALLATLGAISLTSCNHQEVSTSKPSASSIKEIEVKTAKGDFFYQSKVGTDESTYGCAVILSYEEESHKIIKVERDEETISSKGFKEVTDIFIESSWDGEKMKEKYLQGVEKSLSRYIGKTYEDAYNEIRSNIKVAYTSAEKVDVVFSVDDTYKNDDTFIVTTGATLSSSRLALAVANAISNINMLDTLMTIGVDDYSPSGV